MRLLSNHIGNSVFGAICIVLLVIVGLDVISAIIDQLEDIEGNYTFVQALSYVLLTLPGRVHEYIPFASLVGCLIGLGTLASQSELIVMRSAGVSTLRIIGMVMKPAVAMMLLGLLLSEYIAPQAEEMADRRRSMALDGTSALSSQYGLWNREGSEYMHFNAVDAPDKLRGVTLFRFNEQQRLTELLFAPEAIYKEQNWHLLRTVATLLRDEKTELERHENQIWQTRLTPRLIEQIIIKPENLSVTGLWRFSRYLLGQGLSAGEYQLAFWSKVLQPLGTAALVLIAISFIFGPLREVTMGYRIFIGVIVGIIFRTSQDILGPSSLVFGFAPLFAILIPILICLLLGFFLLKQAA